MTETVFFCFIILAILAWGIYGMIPIPNPINTPELLKGKVALITGGSGGIGLAMAESFLKSGAKVIIAGTHEEKLRACCEKINQGG